MKTWFQRLFLALVLVCVVNPAWAANYTASAGIIGQVQSTATSGNVNGGFFNTLNANFLTDGAATSATGNAAVFTSASYNFGAGDVNAKLYIKSGTNWNVTCWYNIDSVASNAATLNSTLGSGVCTNAATNTIAASTVAGVATTASPTGATWGIDYSQTDAARYSDSVLTGATTTCTDATNPFTTQMVGNFINMSSGTGVTAGWYEIVSVSGGTATLDRSAGTTYSSVVSHIGGAISLGGATTGITDAIFFAQGTNSATNAPRIFIKGGSSITYTTQATTLTQVNGNALWPAIVEGYASVRGDRPVSTTRPTLNFGTGKFILGTNAIIRNLQTKSTSANAIQMSNYNYAINVKSLNTGSGTAFTLSTTSSKPAYCLGCEAISYGGTAISLLASDGTSIIQGCYIHDSSVGISNASTASVINITNNIFDNNFTDAINIPTATILGITIQGNTFYGAENKLGVGINLVTGSDGVFVTNNIFYGLVTGVTSADTQTINYDDFNDYYNNTNDVSAGSQWQKGTSDIALAPSFTSAAQITGATATTTAGNHLVQSGATFVTSGVVAGRDFLYIKSGTGVTTGIYGIASVDSETQITTDITLTANATADKVWQITTGHNFAVGTALKATAYPGAFPGALSTGYLDIGAVQRQEAGGGSIFSRIRSGF